MKFGEFVDQSDYPYSNPGGIDFEEGKTVACLDPGSIYVIGLKEEKPIQNLLEWGIEILEKNGINASSPAFEEAMINFYSRDIIASDYPRFRGYAVLEE
ncbi:MAG TPA: hypothetical protein V6C65_04090 [Allocoleopsis sp.]